MIDTRWGLLRHGRALALLLLAAAAAGGCSGDESCGPGQELRGNTCFPVGGGGGAGGMAGGAGSGGGQLDGGAGGAGGSPGGGQMPGAGQMTGGGCNVMTPPMCSGATPGFGAPCLKTSDCGCGTTFCGMQPGATCGFCTRNNCVGQTGVCPAGWSCFDASAFQPGLSLCIPSSATGR